ncbi:Cytochrome c6 [Arenibacter antarcticus]|uniref:PVC-type heme-binding CxxCH protein n=1 Tax=Arenibacter antarcticus TaxID=2040469 RepID=A0ABW5VFR4_9FLAO|nr:PVC-type heme-binding CxxCH protein [Arenibacter sp. H213]
MKKLQNLIELIFFMGMLVSCNQNGILYENGALSPKDGLASYEVVEGFQVELFASEPLISDPVDMAIDENGLMYVVEMSGYPLNKSHTGKIKILKDNDGDGIMDESILFADELMFPNGVMPWKNGIIVTDAPYVLYLEDVDRDGRADVRDTLLTGFSLSNPHVNVNNPIYGLDNWIYLSHFGRIGSRKYEEDFGDLGDEIRFWNDPDGPFLPQNANGKNVRFKTDGESLEILSVKGQFGHTFDEWGHHFLTHNQNHIYEEVLAPQYLNRNPDAGISKAAEDVSDHGNSTEVFQITTNPDRQLFSEVGLTTSTSGITYYSGGIFPAPYDKELTFVMESVSNVVHSDKLTPKGASFTASRMEEGREFFASRDYWARPVNMYIGPDGALYVLDYYRRIIEHPEWMSDEAIEGGDLYDGHNMGRIYRITPKGTPSAQWTGGLELGESTSIELVKFLSHKNRWWRSNAQRLLVDRKDTEVTPLLKKELRTGNAVMGRLHALWTLEGMSALEEEDIIIALHDPSAGLRENAIRIAERYMEGDMELQAELMKMAGDASAKVRFQLLCTLGDLDGKNAKVVREQILFQDIDDEWVQLAALSAGELGVEGLLRETIQRRGRGKESKYDPFISHLTEALGASENQKMIVSLLKQGLIINSTDPVSLQSAILKGLSTGINRNKSGRDFFSPETALLLRAYFDHESDEIRSYTFRLLEILNEKNDNPDIEKAIQKALGRGQNKELRVGYRSQMLKLLLLGDPSTYESEIKALINPSEDPVVQKVALEVYDHIPGASVSEFVLKYWGQMTPGVREAALQSFMRNKERVVLLLDAVEKEKIPKSALGWSRTVQLNQYHVEEIRERARSILAQDDMQEVIASYKSALDMPGDEKKGLEVYKTNCTICHQVRGELGVNYGPDLGTVHNWDAKALMANILVPGLSIAPGYDLWKIEMNNGEILQGVISNETSSAIELHTGPEQMQTINRQEIANIESIPGMSMMPGFGGVLSEQEMADLIAYLRNSAGL